MDLIASAERLPGPGESVSGGTFSMSPGGKAGNQAIQLSRCGMRTLLLSCLGDDLFGRELLQGLRSAGVELNLVRLDDVIATGASVVMTSPVDYASIIAPGAAARLSSSDVDRALPEIETAEALVLQLELPEPICRYAAAQAHRVRTPVVLNASPCPSSSHDISLELLKNTTTLIANRIEAGALLSANATPSSLAEGVAVASALRDKYGVPTVVVTLGSVGVAAVSGNGAFTQDAFPTQVVDTVGAGDAFLGAFVASMVAVGKLDVALERGAAAGALAVERRGAYDALPTAAAIDEFLRGRSRR